MAKSKRTKITDFKRNQGNVFVSVPTPKPVQQVLQARRYFSDWQDVAKQIASSTPITPEPTPENVPVADAKEIRIYAVDCTSGKRQRLFTGKHTDDTADLCQCYANLADCRVESHDAASATVYHPAETSTIPTLSDWVEVHNADDGTLIFVGLREKGFDARCRKYADAKGVGLRVDSAHEPVSRFYTPRADALQYARENAKHFARKYGVPIVEAAGVLAITMLGWAFYVVGGAV